MTGTPVGNVRKRIVEASDWFARMRGPDASSAGAEFEAWRRRPGNDAAYREMEAIWTASAALSPQSVRPHRSVRLRPGLMAAGIAAALTLGFLVWQSTHRTETAIYHSERGQIRSFALADGSRVTLDTGSRIGVDLAGEERRVVLLAGRARFEVAKDRAHPFVVQAGNDAVVARGTVFDVSIAQGGAQVALYEGAVDLERREPGAPPRVVARLRPGQKADFAEGDAWPAIAATRAQPWPDGVFSGENLRLADIVLEANRYGATRIVLGDPALGDLRLSGGFRPRQTRSLADGIAASLDLAVSTQADGTIVLSRKAGAPFSRIEPCATIAGSCPGMGLAG
jgi:transmembrane sensor